MKLGRQMQHRRHVISAHVLEAQLLWRSDWLRRSTQGWGGDLYRVDILALEGPSQFWVRQRATVLLPSMQTGSGTLLSSCRKLRRSPRDLKAAGVTTKFRRSLDWKERFCTLPLWR